MLAGHDRQRPIPASEVIYERAGSTDKTLGFMEGAGHNFTPAYEAESYPGSSAIR